MLFLFCIEITASAFLQENETTNSSTTFLVFPDFYQTISFMIVVILVLMTLSAIITVRVQKFRNRRLFEKLSIEKELNELRISSIHMKVIPHFNSNVLAAIEYNIVSRTKEEAMRLLGIYSDFTLKTLSDVEKAARPLHEELAYAKMYLILEKARFLDKFDFRINIEDGVDEYVKLPNMILHTFCENAVNHGIMPLKTGGLIKINVSRFEQSVRACVEDNGVGRKYAVRNPQPHNKKKGLSIVKRQIEIYNRFNDKKIKQTIEDITDNNGRPSGTRFIIDVPSDYTYYN